MIVCALITLLCGSPGQFSLGVAAGDVTDTGAVLWTRADAPGGMALELAANAAFEPVMAFNVHEADPASDLTLHIPISGLEPAETYYYRFRRLDDAASVSATGRFRTLPAPDTPAPLRFIFSGDTNFAYAPFTAVGAAAAEDADFAIWFGDVIYADVSAGGLGEARTRGEYRAKYRQIRSDPHIQELLASTCVWMGWDDHEVRNDYAGTDPDLDPAQREAAYGAFFEYVPLSRRQTSPSDPYRTYRSFRCGAAAEFFLLDARQYREVSARRACGDNPDPLGFSLGPLTFDAQCRELLRAPRDLLGPGQFGWLKEGLRNSTAAVKFVVNNVPLTRIGVFPYDRWDGYEAQRRDLLAFIDAQHIENVIFLTTDIHANALNPDVTQYSRRYRPDYGLRNGTRIAEIIAGPWGNATLRAELTTIAALLAGLPNTPPASDLILSLEQRLEHKIAAINELAFIESNRTGYAVIDVSAEGAVRVTFQAVRDRQFDDAGTPVAETLYTAPLDDSRPSPCGLPLPALAGMTLVSFTRVRRVLSACG